MVSASCGSMVGSHGLVRRSPMFSASPKDVEHLNIAMVIIESESGS